jgi:hypothetical protein
MNIWNIPKSCLPLLYACAYTELRILCQASFDPNLLSTCTYNEHIMRTEIKSQLPLLTEVYVIINFFPCSTKCLEVHIPLEYLLEDPHDHLLVMYEAGLFFLAAKYRGRTCGWWLVANTPTTGSPSVFCSQKKEPWYEGFRCFSSTNSFFMHPSVNPCGKD